MPISVGTTFQLHVRITTEDVGYICLLMFINVYGSVLTHSSTVVMAMKHLDLTLLVPCAVWAWASARVVDMVTYHSLVICVIWVIAG